MQILITETGGPDYTAWFIAGTLCVLLVSGILYESPPGLYGDAGSFDDCNQNQWLADREAEIVLSSPAPNVIGISARADTKHRNEIRLHPVHLRPQV